MSKQFKFCGSAFYMNESLCSTQTDVIRNETPWK